MCINQATTGTSISMSIQSTPGLGATKTYTEAEKLACSLENLEACEACD